MSKRGTIYLVGTGPGETGLLTVKALALLREADAIVGDIEPHTRLLHEARPEAEIHDVGCRTSQSQFSQDEINQLLVELAGQGKTVVRLWPGDPFIYGRAAQELAAARQAGLRVELVPGVTSAIAAPAYAGVPVTHWEVATSFAVTTGFESKNPAVRADWAALARMETLVVLMPLDDLSDIVAKLLAAGRPAETPAVVVQHGTLPQQQQVLGTLETIITAVQTAQLGPPAILVVGAVAGLARELAWFGMDIDVPLRGRRVLVTRPAHQAAGFMAELRSLGAEPISFPTIAIEPVADTRPLDEAIRRIGDWVGQHLRPSQLDYQESTSSLQSPRTQRQPPYDWLVLTSVNGVTAFWDRLESAGLDSRCLASLRIAAIGPATAAVLRQRSITPDLVPEEYTAEGILDAFDRAGPDTGPISSPISGQRFLLARADIARKTLAEGLQQRGAQVDEIAAYRTVPVQHGPLPPPTDIVTFTSSSTVQGYVNCLAGRSPAEILQDSQVICIGPITAATARELGLPVTAVAEKFTIEGVLETLREVQL